MEIKELRIGNYVIDNLGGILKINGIRTESDLSHIRPIPLTEEWLLKFGFSHEDDYMELEVNDSLSIIWVGYLAINMQGGINFLNSNQKSIHQLQNLYFALTNQELTWK
jgi:hypothetical protein